MANGRNISTRFFSPMVHISEWMHAGITVFMLELPDFELFDDVNGNFDCGVVKKSGQLTFCIDFDTNMK